MIFLGIIVSIIIFSIIVLAHEYGHFKTARIFGVKVYEFGLGIPPKAKELFKDKLGTSYTLNWLPLGGFVRLKGENFNHFFVYDENKKIYKQDILEKILKSDEKVFDRNGEEIGKEEIKEIIKLLKENKDNDNLVNKPYIQQSIVMLAGIFMNFLLAIIIFWGLFWFGVKPVGINDKIETSLPIKLFPTYEQSIEYGIIKENSGAYLFPLTGSIAAISGIKNEDFLIKINGKEILKSIEVKEFIRNNNGKLLIFEIKRKDKIINISVVPKNGIIGTHISPNIVYNKDFEYKYGFLEAGIISIKETYYQSLLTFKGIYQLGKKLIAPEKKEEREEAIKSMSGPIGIVSIVTTSITAGLIMLLILSAVISINLGVFNLLPLGALDGGRWLFLTLNQITKIITGKKQISPIIEGIIHTSFFVLLIILSIIVAYNDINKF